MIITRLLSFDSCMPMGYYQGVNIIFYPNLIDGETLDFLKLFAIDIDKLFQNQLRGKRYERFVCDAHIIKILEALYEAAKEGDRIHMKIHILHILTEFVHYEGAKQKKYHSVTKKQKPSVRLNTISKIICRCILRLRICLPCSRYLKQGLRKTLNSFMDAALMNS